ETETPGTTAATCALISSVSWSRSPRRKGRTVSAGIRNLRSSCVDLEAAMRCGTGRAYVAGTEVCEGLLEHHEARQAGDRWALLDRAGDRRHGGGRAVLRRAARLAQRDGPASGGTCRSR